MKLPITITYQSGETAQFIAQPPDWAKWEKETNNTIRQTQEKMGIWDLMFLAYQAHKRLSAGKPIKPFDVWMESVADVDVQVGDDVDPKVSQ